MSYKDELPRPHGPVEYNSLGSNTGFDDNRYNQPYYPPPKKQRNKWILIGCPILLIIIIAAVVGGVLGARSSKHNNTSSSSSSGNGPGTADGAHSSLLHEQGRFAISTDSYFLPVYPSTTDTAQYGQPTFVEANNPAINWPADTWTTTNPSITNLRPDRPRLIAGKYKIQALPTLMAGDPYLKGWNDIIMANASYYKDQPPTVHVFDGGPTASGILDPAREVKQRIKHFAYAYLMTNDTSWVDRAYRELQNSVTWADDTSVAGNDPTDPWNSPHFLDCAELTAAHAIAYDWLYDQWTDDQKSTIRSNIIQYGIAKGVSQYATNAFWLTVNGNWNCVSNTGMIMGCLAIAGDDTTGACNTFLNQALTNAGQNCVNVPEPSGSGSETANYWYFAMSALAELASTLQLAAGSDFGIMTNNPSMNMTALYHIYVYGMTSLFNYGDHGPNKYSTTDNCLFWFGSYYNIPMYTLWQRDQFDAAEPWSMFWYDPGASGAWWDGLPLDKLFDDDQTRWGSMRTTWTDNDGMYVAMKASKLTGHQTHGDLDCGDFVLDAMGQRWAGELGSADYLGDGYFSSEAQDSVRWLWYRKMTEGQNTLSIAGANQNVDALPVVTFGSTGEAQGSSTVFEVPNTSTAYMTADLSTAYFGADIKRGIRFINGRKQVLLQDELTNVNATTYWRMHTNATVTIDGNNANLSLGGKNLQVQLINPPTGVTWQTLDPVRTADAPQLQTGQEADQPNPGVTVLGLNIPSGTNTIQVLFNPQWDGFSSFITPSLVALSGWSTTSHQ